MSARAPVGAANRSDLFGGAKQDEGRLDPEFPPDNGGLGDDPLQLEHMIGYSGAFRGLVQMLPRDENQYVKSMGALLVVENLSDPHQQRILRGHDAQVSVMTMSPSGRWMASGQLGTKSFKGNSSPVFVWDTVTWARRLVLRGLTMQVSVVDFSPDENFLCGCGEDSSLHVWDLSSGEVILCHRLPKPASVVRYTRLIQDGRRVKYELVVGFGSTLNLCVLSFDPTRVQWGITFRPFQLPPGHGGLTRYFCCIELSPDETSVLIGSTGGDLMVYRRDTAVYRACIPVSKNYLPSILALPDGRHVICGGGDGILRKLEGSTMDWVTVEQVALDSAVVSMSMSCNGLEIIASCVSGNTYRVSIDGLSAMLCGASHTGPVTCIAFGTSIGYFATGSASGDLRVWDIGDYGCQAITKVAKAGAVNSVFVLNSNSSRTGDALISGWEDGGLRCHDLDSLSRQLWIVTNAHRAGVLSVTVHRGDRLEYILSGGADNAVRVWNLNTRELLAQYQEQTRPILRVLVDCRQFNLFHSISLDGSIMTFDFIRQRRVVAHLIPKGTQLAALTQRKDSEQELVTCDTGGCISFWDCDYPEAVMNLQDPARSQIRCAEVSPSGRFLAFAGDDGAVKVLNLQSSEILSVGVGHAGVVRTLSWTPDERQIVTGGDDCSLCVWNFFLGGSA